MPRIAREIPELTKEEALRLIEKVEFSRDCWNWLGGLRGKSGYGDFTFKGKTWLAHRVAYYFFTKEKVPHGMHLDHLCRNRKCVNPTHLEVVTQRENTLRGVGLPAIYAKRTHCVNGHKFTSDNLMKPGRRGCWRRCKECSVIYSREYRKRKRELSVK